MIHSGHPLTLGRIFSDNARYLANEPALVLGDTTRTYRQLYERAQQFAAGCVALDLRKQDRIAVLSTNRIEFVETYVAGWTAGFVVATVNFRLSLPEIAEILRDAAPRLLCIDDQFAHMVAEIRIRVPGIEHVVVYGEAPDAIAYDTLITPIPFAQSLPQANEEDVASLIYTSGTTGRPKGCILGQRECAFNTQIVAQVMNNAPGDRFLCVMPLFHIGAMAIVLTVLAHGGVVHIHRQFEPDTTIHALQHNGITHALLAPTMVQMMLHRLDDNVCVCPALRMIIYSAAPMPSTVLRRGIAIFGRIFLQMLGSSEGSGITFLPMNLHRPDGDEDDRQRLLSVGYPFPNVAIRIVDDDNADCPPGKPGELLLKSPVMFRGYWNATASTLDAVRDGWFHTGDVGRFDADGFLYLVDRIKDMIICGGENIYPREVEEALIQHPAVDEAAVIGRENEIWGETVCAVVVTVPGAGVTADELIAHTRILIASYKKPREVIFADALPRLASGKIDKKALRQRHGLSSG